MFLFDTIFDRVKNAPVPVRKKSADGEKEKDRSTKENNLDSEDLRQSAIDVLNAHPEAMEAFEREYRKASLLEYGNGEQNLFTINSRQAVEKSRNGAYDDAVNAMSLTKRIVDELLMETEPKRITDKTVPPVALEEINSLPAKLRPQLTGSLMHVDIEDKSYIAVLDMLTMYKKTGNKQFYHMFRSGLDRLDLDPVMYEIIGMNRNSIGYWFPSLKKAAEMQDFFKVPETKIAKVPITLLQLTRMDYDTLTATTKDIVNKWAFEAFGLDENRTYFVKTGTYSSKFDFRNAKVTTPQEVRELGSYLLFIHYQALAMSWAHVFIQTKDGKPVTSTYGASTTNEWCVREYIEDKENNPCIYHGMPLHTEYRVFVDFDTDEVLGIVPYWHPEVMKKRFSKLPDADTADMKHDYVIYCTHEKTLMRRYEENKDAVVKHIEEMLPNVELTGQWSVDIMQNGDDFWLIDMAVASSSALSEYIPKGKIVEAEENWIPEIFMGDNIKKLSGCAASSACGTDLGEEQ